MVDRELQRCGLTRKDISALLRQHGVTALEEVAFAIFEQSGRISIIRSDTRNGELVTEIVEQVGARDRGQTG